MLPPDWCGSVNPIGSNAFFGLSYVIKYAKMGNRYAKTGSAAPGSCTSCDAVQFWHPVCHEDHMWAEAFHPNTRRWVGQLRLFFSSLHEGSVRQCCLDSVWWESREQSATFLDCLEVTAQNLDSGNRGSHPESCMWLGSGSRSTLVEVRKRLWSHDASLNTFH